MTTERIALVTGAGTGVGRASSIALAADGWTIVAAGRRREPLEETRALVESAGSAGWAHPTDVADPASVGALFDAIETMHGRLDVLFNNAGTASPPRRSNRSRSTTGSV